MTNRISKGTVALCVPAYNAAEYLPRLFGSVRSQTVPFDEVLVYDDASTDNTAQVAASLGARVLRGQANLGCSAGKNALLEQIVCGWVHFHDADDTLAPEFVARAKARMVAESFDVLLIDYEQVDEETGALMSRSSFSESDILKDPVSYMLVNTVNNGGVYSADLLRSCGGFDVDPMVQYNEDRAFHLRLAEADARFSVEPYVGSRFYFRRGSMSSANRMRCCLANQEITIRFAERHPGAYRSGIASVSWLNAACLASCLSWQEADACVELAVASEGKIPSNASLLFKTLCATNPYLAIRFREAAIRLFKPACRVGYPALSVLGRTN